MKDLTVLSENGENKLLEALTTARGIHGEPFFVVTQDKKHVGPGGTQQAIHWKASFRLTPVSDGSIHLQLTKDDFPTNSTIQIQQFYKSKVIPTITKLAQKIGVSVLINLNYQRRSDNVGIVTPL